MLKDPTRGALACLYLHWPFTLEEKGESAFGCKWDFFSLDEHLPLVHVAYPQGGKDDAQLHSEKEVKFEKLANSPTSQIQEKNVIYCRQFIAHHHSSSAGHYPSFYHMHKQFCLNPNPIHYSIAKEGQDKPLPPSIALFYKSVPFQMSI